MWRWTIQRHLITNFKNKTMLKRFKQELIFIPIMLILIEVFRRVVYHYFPDTAMFDRGSELETYLTRVWQIVWITCGSWVLLRVTFPSVHKALVEFYDDFNTLDKPEKRGIALKFFFCFFFGLVFLMSGRANNEVQLRKKLVDTVTSQLYVREATGRNDGVDVEKYLSFVGQTKGASWCAAFTSYNLHAVGVTNPPNPKSAWSPSFASKHIVWSPALLKQHKVKSHPQPGDCFTLYFENLKRVGHVGFIIGENAEYFITIEGNTGTTGSREGSGVHKYKRAKQKVYAVTNYITPFINEKNTSISNPSNSSKFVDIVQMATYRKHRSKQGKNCYQYYQNGFTSSDGYDISFQRGQCKNYGAGCSGQIGRSKPAGNCNGIATNEINGIYYKRKSICQLHLQGLGRKGDTPREENNGTDGNSQREATRENYRSNKRGTVYSEMG